jgi:homoserine O-acetyltransferase
MDFETYRAGHVRLQKGGVLDDAQLAYKTYGRLADDKRNLIVLCTPFGGRHSDLEWMIGTDRALNPDRHFIVAINTIGNGLSSSPVHEPWATRRHFPLVTMHDNVRLQRALVTDIFGVERIKLTIGWSMGGQAAYHWAAIFPDQVEKFVCLCGSARTARHNFVFLESIKAALQADPAFQNGWFTAVAERGLKAAAFAFASWALSQDFYRQHVDETLGLADLADFLKNNWQQPFLARDANNLCALIATWQNADISDNPLYGGDLDRALAAIEADGLIMPSETDLYFPIEDNRLEVERLRRARLLPIPSIWGHRAGNNPANPADAGFVNREIAKFLLERPN